jgi:acyl-CoA thioester hydrolase
MSDEIESPALSRKENFRHWTRDIVRYADTDRRGHVDNAVFSTFPEIGRVTILYDPQRPPAPASDAYP